jgi:hypothetical protein
MRDLFFKTTRARHPSKKLRFVYKYLTLQKNVVLFARPRSFRSMFARFQILRKMFIWFYSDRFARRHVFKRLLKSHISGYSSFLSFCTKLETVIPVFVYRLHFVQHLKESFIALQNGFIYKNGQRVGSFYQVVKPGDLVELPIYKNFSLLCRNLFYLNFSSFDVPYKYAYWLPKLQNYAASFYATQDSFFLGQANSYNRYLGLAIKTKSDKRATLFNFFPYFLAYKMQDLHILGRVANVLCQKFELFNDFNDFLIGSPLHMEDVLLLSKYLWIDPCFMPFFRKYPLLTLDKKMFPAKFLSRFNKKRKQKKKTLRRLAPVATSYSTARKVDSVKLPAPIIQPKMSPQQHTVREILEYWGELET